MTRLTTWKHTPCFPRHGPLGAAGPEAAASLASIMVRLWCPAKNNCYHIMAARMAVGIKDNEKRQPLNLTQLRRNKRKRADKVSGRKRPRPDDVDVVPTADADPEVAAALVEAINGHGNMQQESDVEPDNQPAEINLDICYACNATNPPPRKGGRRVKNKNHFNQETRQIDWVECETCGRWFHCSCVEYDGGQFVCDFC